MSANPAPIQNAQPPTYPQVNDHVLTRWSERTDTDVSIWEAWYRGIDMTDELPYYDDGRGDIVRIRYYPAERILLVNRDTELRTVLRPDEAEARGFGYLVKRLAEEAVEGEPR